MVLGSLLQADVGEIARKKRMKWDGSAVEGQPTVVVTTQIKNWKQTNRGNRERTTSDRSQIVWVYSDLYTSKKREKGGTKNHSYNRKGRGQLGRIYGQVRQNRCFIKPRGGKREA